MSPQTFPITELTPEVMGYAYRLSDSDKEPSTYNILRAVHQSLFGPPQILLIEAFDGLMPAGPTFPQVIRKFLIDCQTFCKDWDCTIIGTAPAIKQKMGEAAPAPMDVIAGHSSWGSGVSTAFVITYAQVAQMAPTLTRRLFISAPVVEDRYAYAKFDPRGRLELATRTHVDPLAETRAKLSKRLEMEKPGTSFRRNDFIGWGQELEISQRSVERWISEVIDLGMLEKYGRTVNARYQKPNPS